HSRERQPACADHSIHARPEASTNAAPSSYSGTAAIGLKRSVSERSLKLHRLLLKVMAEDSLRRDIRDGRRIHIGQPVEAPPPRLRRTKGQRVPLSPLVRGLVTSTQLFCLPKMFLSQVGHTQVLKSAPKHPVVKGIVRGEFVSLFLVSAGFFQFA